MDISFHQVAVDLDIEGNFDSVKYFMQLFCLRIVRYSLLMKSLHHLLKYMNLILLIMVFFLFENMLLGGRTTFLESDDLDLNCQLYCRSLGKLFSYHDPYFPLL